MNAVTCVRCRHAIPVEGYEWLVRCRVGEFKGIRAAADPLVCPERSEA